jgi:hypothetical protein
MIEQICPVVVPETKTMTNEPLAPPCPPIAPYKKEMIVAPEPEFVQIEVDCSEQLVLNIAIMKVCGIPIPKC